MLGQYGGIWGLLVLIADIWAIVNIVQSGVKTEVKILWVVIVALLPLIGVVLWYFIGPKTSRS
jgi:hypothetical protein